MVIITGTNFIGSTAVKFGDTDALSFTVDSATQITAVVGSGTSGKIAVTTEGGTATSGIGQLVTDRRHRHCCGYSPRCDCMVADELAPQWRAASSLSRTIRNDVALNRSLLCAIAEVLPPAHRVNLARRAGGKQLVTHFPTIRAQVSVHHSHEPHAASECDYWV